MLKLLFLDTETTGLDPTKHGVVQIAGLIDVQGKVENEFNLKCQPFRGDRLEPEALKVNGLSKEVLETFPAPGEVYQSLLATFDTFIDRYQKADKFFLIGQNVKFDYDMMDVWFKKNGNQYWYAYVQYHLIDIVALTAAFRAAGLIDVPNMKLETMTSYFGIEHQAHEGLSDVKAVREIWYKYVDLLRQIKMPQSKAPSKEGELL